MTVTLDRRTCPSAPSATAPAGPRTPAAACSPARAAAGCLPAGTPGSRSGQDGSGPRGNARPPPRETLAGMRPGAARSRQTRKGPPDEPDEGRRDPPAPRRGRAGQRGRRRRAARARAMPDRPGMPAASTGDGPARRPALPAGRHRPQPNGPLQPAPRRGSGRARQVRRGHAGGRARRRRGRACSPAGCAGSASPPTRICRASGTTPPASRPAPGRSARSSSCWSRNGCGAPGSPYGVAATTRAPLAAPLAGHSACRRTAPALRLPARPAAAVRAGADAESARPSPVSARQGRVLPGRLTTPPSRGTAAGGSSGPRHGPRHAAPHG